MGTVQNKNSNIIPSPNTFREEIKPTIRLKTARVIQLQFSKLQNYQEVEQVNELSEYDIQYKEC
jgi:hypothetical protein